MKAMAEFFQTMWRMPAFWRFWVGLLMAINAVGPLFFLDTVEGKVVLAAMLLSAATMMALFARKGFVRLLGLGHIFWIPLVCWLVSRLDPGAAASPLTLWLLSVIACNSISLLIDAVDVIRYLRGEKEAYLQLPGNPRIDLDPAPGGGGNGNPYGFGSRKQ